MTKSKLDIEEFLTRVCHKRAPARAQVLTEFTSRDYPRDELLRAYIELRGVSAENASSEFRERRAPRTPEVLKMKRWLFERVQQCTFDGDELRDTVMHCSNARTEIAYWSLDQILEQAPKTTSADAFAYWERWLRGLLGASRFNEFATTWGYRNCRDLKHTWGMRALAQLIIDQLSLTASSYRDWSVVEDLALTRMTDRVLLVMTLTPTEITRRLLNGYRTLAREAAPRRR